MNIIELLGKISIYTHVNGIHIYESLYILLTNNNNDSGKIVSKTIDTLYIIYTNINNKHIYIISKEIDRYVILYSPEYFNDPAEHIVEF